MELVKQKTGVDLTFISYRGASAAAADVLSGQIPMVIANIDSLMGQVNAGKLKPIASTGAQRSGAAPNTPTFVEAGFPDLIVTSWSLWAVPAKTPAAIKEKLRLGTEKALKQPDVIESMKVGGFDPGTMSVAEADAYIKTEYQRWGEVIRAAGIKPQ
jgi:tripartite-type tricarboxylate transporter receptor subunit TctC